MSVIHQQLTRMVDLGLWMAGWAAVIAFAGAAAFVWHHRWAFGRGWTWALVAPLIGLAAFVAVGRR